jgi:hypothetical protein
MRRIWVFSRLAHILKGISVVVKVLTNGPEKEENDYE